MEESPRFKELWMTANNIIYIYTTTLAHPSMMPNAQEVGMFSAVTWIHVHGEVQIAGLIKAQ